MTQVRCEFREHELRALKNLRGQPDTHRPWWLLCWPQRYWCAAAAGTWPWDEERGIHTSYFRPAVVAVDCSIDWRQWEQW